MSLALKPTGLMAVKSKSFLAYTHVFVTPAGTFFTHQLRIKKITFTTTLQSGALALLMKFHSGV